MITTATPRTGPRGVATVAGPLKAAGVGFLACLMTVLAGCSSGRDTTASTLERSTTTASHDAAHGPMAPATATVAEIGAIGPGPAPGATFDGFIGMNVCGRFLPLSTTVPSELGAATGIALPSEGRFSITPPTEQAAGRSATVGSLARALGVQLDSRAVTFGEHAAPAQIEVSGTTIAVAGKTFGPEVRCGDTPAEVQLWVYSAKAVETGEGLVKVIEHPQDVPVAEDGMAFVVAVTPESSLPTLPPSALVR